MSYNIKKITIDVVPGEDKRIMQGNMLQAAIDHQCRVYAVFNGDMHTVSYTTLRASITKIEEE